MDQASTDTKIGDWPSLIQWTTDASLSYPINESLFSQRIQPVLATCRRERTFTPGRGLFEELLPRIQEFQATYHGRETRTLIEQAAEGLSFDAGVWRAVVGEVFLFAADDLPLLRLSPRCACCLLAGAVVESDRPISRSELAPIEQVLYGSRDLVFAGHCYRPDVAGYNDQADIARLAEFLEAIDPERLRPADLANMPEPARRRGAGGRAGVCAAGLAGAGGAVSNGERKTANPGGGTQLNDSPFKRQWLLWRSDTG